VFSADQARRLLFLCSFSLVRSCPTILVRELCSTQFGAGAQFLFLMLFFKGSAAAEVPQPELRLPDLDASQSSRQDLVLLALQSPRQDT
jgi:hypothetical protein